MHQDLLTHVVSFVNDRGLRDALGYPWQRCMALKIAPCTLQMEPHVNASLTDVYTKRSKNKETQIYYAQERVLVYLRGGPPDISMGAVMVVFTGVDENHEKGSGWWYQDDAASSRKYAWKFDEVAVSVGEARLQRQDRSIRGTWVTNGDYVVK